ncbi:hypothetical protein, partial [Pseudomonas veronii]|uniref:hypothetical protein n=1 Tax=Pseudomonas veronii TaxID=76761 RepID=UPI001CA3A940
YLQPDPRLRRGVHTALPSWPPGFNGGVFYRKSYFLGLRTEPSKLRVLSLVGVKICDAFGIAFFQ